MTKFSLPQQIEEVQREITLRERVYPHQVASGKMRQSVADFHMDRMRAVLETLRGYAVLSAEVERLRAELFDTATRQAFREEANARSGRKGDDQDNDHLP